MTWSGRNAAAMCGIQRRVNRLLAFRYMPMHKVIA